MHEPHPATRPISIRKMPAELWRKVAVCAFERGQTITQFVIAALRDYVSAAEAVRGE